MSPYRQAKQCTNSTRSRCCHLGKQLRLDHRRGANLTDEDHALVEIRTLGAFRVRRADGSWVDPAEWRTRKTVELLRILALLAGQRVSVDVLIETLWGDVDPERARTSLRTAASQIRRVLRQDCVARRQDGLALTDVWVDAHRFKSLAAECRQLHAEGRHVDAVVVAHRAEALYIHDVDGSDGDGLIGIEREALRKRRLDMLIDAAASAAGLRWVRDATSFAEMALEIDPTSESACRAAMLAFHAAGEMERALSIYQECRARLVDSLGVGPSAATQAVYLQLLRADSTQEPEIAFVGLEPETSALTSRLAMMCGNGGGFLVLSGPPRAGSSRWLAEAMSRLDASMPLNSVNQASPANAAPVDDAPAVVSTVDGIETWERGELRTAVLAQQQNASSGHPGVVAAIHRSGVDKAADIELDALVHEGLVQRLDVPTLADDDAGALTALLVSGEPSPALAEELRRITGNRAGRMVDTITSWLAQGRLTTTKQGVDLTPDPGESVENGLGRHQLEQVHDGVSGEELTVLEIVAVANSPISITAMLALLASDESTVAAEDDVRAHIEGIVATLEERGVLSVDGSGRYDLPARPLREAISAWMRPRTWRRLNRFAAERLNLSFDARVDHWIEAGEPRLACAAAMEGAVHAMAETDFREARRRLHQVLELMDSDTSSPEDTLDILNRLTVCSARMGDRQDSVEYRRQVIEHATVNNLPVPDFQELMSHLDGPALAARARLNLLDRLGISVTSAPTAEAEALLRDAVVRAELRGDEDAAVEARLLLVGLILVPKRNFSGAYQVLEEVDQINARLHLSTARLARYEAAVLLGDPSVDLDALDSGWRDSLQSVGATSGLSGMMLRALAHHDRGAAHAAQLCDEAIADAESRDLAGPWRWVAARMLLQRGELGRARELTRSAGWRVGGPTSQILALLGKADLAVAEQNRTTGAALLLRAAEIAQRTGATLLLPEVASRMVIDREDNDRDSALDFLDLAEIAIGEATTGRERVILMLARAAVRDVVGRPLSAAAIAGGAASLATTLGLVYCASEAAASRAAYLAKAGEDLATLGTASGDAAYPIQDIDAEYEAPDAPLRAVASPPEDPPYDR